MNARPLHVLAAAVLALAVALAGCGHRSSAKPGAAGAAPAAALLAATDVTRAARADLTAGVPVSGTLAPAVEVRIAAPVGEVLDEVPVREGQAVARGQVLARFRTTSLRPQAASAEAAWTVARADHERMRNLFAEGAVSKREVEGAEAQLRAAEAQWAAAASRLADAEVRAPIAGVIAARHVQGGDRLGEGDPLFMLVNTAELEFEATVPSAHVPFLAPGMPVRLDVSGFPAGGVRGRVARVNATADPATRQVKVYVRVPNPGGRLVGGLFASGSIVTKEAVRALAVPGAAVHDADGEAWVMVVTQGALARRAVRLGVRDESRDLVEIVSGLTEDDVVVTAPVEGLEPGRPVQVGGQES